MRQPSSPANRSSGTDQPRSTVRPARRTFRDPSPSLPQLPGNQRFLSVTGWPRVQTKLQVGPPDDRFEKEADEAARMVVDMTRATTPAGLSRAHGENTMQRKWAISP
jgi:hypothetical protein